MAKKLKDIKDSLRPLLKRHGISETDRNRWLLLAHELVGDITSEAPTWSPERIAEEELLYSVLTEVNENKLTISAACEKLATEEPWKSLTDRNRRLFLAHYLEEEFSSKAPAKRGRKKKWTPELEEKLIRSVWIKVNENDLTISAACKKLATEEPWKSLVKPVGSSRTSADVLRERYQKLWLDCFDVYEHIETGELELIQRPRRKIHRRGKYET